MSDTRPYHIAALDAALEDARARVDAHAGSIRILEKTHADVFSARSSFSELLSRSESDRIGVENAIRDLGYDIPPRKKVTA